MSTHPNSDDNFEHIEQEKDENQIQHSNSNKKLIALPELYKEYKSMDIMQFINHPRTIVYRYIPEAKSEGHKRKSRNVCHVCGGDQDELIKLPNHSRKYIHPWCYEPFQFNKEYEPQNDSIIDLNKQPHWNDVNNYSFIRGLPDEPLKLHFNKYNPSLSFLENNALYDEMNIEQKEISEEEDTGPRTRRSKQRTTRKQRDVSPAPIQSNGNEKRNTRSQQKISKSSPSSDKINNLLITNSKQDVKSWCLKKVKEEQNILMEQLSQYIKYTESSSAQKNKMLRKLVDDFNIPNITDSSNSDNIVDDVLHGMELNNLMDQKDFFDASLFSEMDNNLLKFLAWQRVQQLKTQQFLHRQMPHISDKPHKISKLSPNDQNKQKKEVQNKPFVDSISGSTNAFDTTPKYSFKHPVIIIPDSSNIPAKNQSNYNGISHGFTMPSTRYHQNETIEQGHNLGSLMPLFNHPLINAQQKMTENNNQPISIQHQSIIHPHLQSLTQTQSLQAPKIIPSQIHPQQQLQIKNVQLKPIQPHPISPLLLQSLPHSIQPQYQHLQPQIISQMNTIPPQKSSYLDYKKRSHESIDNSSNLQSGFENQMIPKKLKTIDNMNESIHVPQHLSPLNSISILSDINNTNLIPSNAIAVLRGIGQNEKTFISFITKEPYHIGRKIEGLSLDLLDYTDNKTISHMHATIICKDEGKSFYIITRGRNGTRVNGEVFKPVEGPEQVPLTHGSIIEMGKVVMIFEILR